MVIQRDIADISYAIELAAIQQSAFTYTPALSSDTFEGLRSTGKLGLLRDEKLKAALFDYYRFDDGQRQFQSQQLEFAAKILNNEQRVWVQDNYYVFGPRTADGAKYPESRISAVANAARRLQESPDFHRQHP